MPQAYNHTYLGVDREVGIPVVRRYYFDDSILLSLRRNLAHVLERVSKFLRCWGIRRGFLESEEPI